MKSLVSPDYVHGDRLLHGGPPSTEECLVAVFDFDGVLAQENPLENVLKPRDPGVRALIEALDLGLEVYIVSGRRASERHIVARLLRESGIPLSRVSGMHLRSRSVGEIDHKIAIISMLSLETCIAELHDDNPYVLHSARRFVRCGVLHLDDGCEIAYGRPITRTCIGGAVGWKGLTRQ